MLDRCDRTTPMRRRAFSLVELVVVLAILATLVAVVIPMTGTAPDDAARTATLTTMRVVRAALVGDPDRPGMPAMIEDLRRSPGFDLADLELDDLLRSPFMADDPPRLQRGIYDPVSKRGWRGPYLLARTSVLDGWGRPIELQWPGPDVDTRLMYARLVSPGRDGVLQIDPDDPDGYPRSDTFDDIVLFLSRNDVEDVP